MVFNPEDEENFGPHCRNCHKGSSGCGGCHTTSGSAWAGDINGVVNTDTAANTGSTKSSYNMYQVSTAAYGTWNNWVAKTMGDKGHFLFGTGAAQNNTETTTGARAFFKQSSTVTMADENWRTSDSTVAITCSDDGFSWPHRTLGWKMLKDDLFGLDFDGDPIAVGETRTYEGSLLSGAAHDIDSVCLDCHNPTVWNATSSTDHVDDPNDTTDNFDDELLLRGLP